eukprot:TRINITY_DN15997_c0_g1_i1.p1 TRINITY_DN15997_c0_g1~~TRINITY_DN15997_c0_g1_i1.p1  ORF type:complete len:556 (+),score=117.95 TRINITY_DN15997_c0_g1_i1:64-1731(+)
MESEIKSPHPVTSPASDSGSLAEMVQVTTPLLNMGIDGADVTYPIYKAVEKARQNSLRRSRSDASLDNRGDPFGVESIRQMVQEPQGFRRWHVAGCRGAVVDGKGGAAYERAFIRMLFGMSDGSASDEDEQATPEETKLDAFEEPPRGLTFAEAFFSMLKGIIGSGVLVLPSAFAKVGLLFAVFALASIASLTGYCITLLMRTRGTTNLSFPDIGTAAMGPFAGTMVRVSMVSFQTGLIIIYHIFVGQTVKSILEGVTGCADWAVATPVSHIIAYHAAVQSLVSWVRRMKYLAWIAICADIFIVVGLASVLANTVSVLAQRGPQEIDSVVLAGAGVFIGTAVSSFEGICVMIPIADAMQDRGRFTEALTYALLTTGVLFLSIGTVCYVVFGRDVQANVLMNLGAKSGATQLVSVMYLMAIACSVPLQSLPAFRVVEGSFGLPSGKVNARAKWIKNAFRFCFVFATAIVASEWIDSLGNIMALLGGLAGAPLGFVYPPIFHLALSRRRGWATPASQAIDVGIFVLGVFLSALSTGVALLSWQSKPEPRMTQCSTFV